MSFEIINSQETISIEVKTMCDTCTKLSECILNDHVFDITRPSDKMAHYMPSITTPCYCAYAQNIIDAHSPSLNLDLKGKTTILILGTPYTIEYKSESEDPKLKDLNGYCDGCLKQIVIENHKDDTTVSDAAKKIKMNESLRHEIIHAFLNESGLSNDSLEYSGSWSKNEEMVDWFAIQFHKIEEVFDSLGV